MSRLVLVSLLALAVVPAAHAAPRMLVGFQDDPNFRWSPDRAAVLDLAEGAHATIVRTTVYWNKVAPRRPLEAASSFDPAYRFADLDEMVRNAQLRGMEVMLTIWGTPAWANGDRGPNRLPTRLADLNAFAHALASRYSGRYPGFPFVRYYSVWNEPNLQQFLAPQFDERGRPVSPGLYAQLYRAGYAGIRLGNSLAQVAVGETSARGRSAPSPGLTQDALAPGLFAQLVARSRPRLQFAAWSLHPYPTAPNLPPTQRVAWPNVTLTQLPRFERSLDAWFGRKGIPVWITEYGHQSRPQSPSGVSYGLQASYAATALQMAARDPRVGMFVWFVLRDDPTCAWKSGLLTVAGVRKPAYTRFAAVARGLDARNAVVSVPGGSPNPLVRIWALELAAHGDVGTRVGVRYKVLDGDRLEDEAEPMITVARDGFLSVRLRFVPEPGRTYVVPVEVSDTNGNTLSRTLTLAAR